MRATSTDTDPESAKKTWAMPGTSPTRRSANDTAGSCVNPPNITWENRSICPWAAASRAGCRYPWIAHHHDDIASMASNRSPSADRRPSRTPEADSAAYGIGPSSGP